MQKISSLINEIKESKSNLEFMKTGFKTLDSTLDGGFMRKELVVIGGHTGIGKSYVAGQLLLNIAEQGFSSAYFSLEISSHMVASRLIGSLSNLKPTRIRSGLLEKSEYHEKLEAEAALSAYDDYMAFYDDTYEIDLIIKEIRDKGYEFVVIDFIQNIFSKGSHDEYARLSKVALDLQKAAKDLNCCILVLSQLSNSVARDKSIEGTLEYKGSGAIAMVCDLGFFLERETYKPGMSFQGLKLKLRKNRRGIAGIVYDLAFKQPGGMIIELK